MEENNFNRNDKQKNFNQIKGRITELNDGVKFCSVTIDVGHENPRLVNLTLKKEAFEACVNAYKVDDRVAIKFYITSRKSETRWTTMANVLNIEKVL